ncbi:hypothetical protein G3480_02730 [Thiorhodococcus mannitoliphagus]|uniref:Uncharacterized protein n=1 Tax=Thiorhodococcus mannitoliphagus TaxID=329406 RepID=A0A6P1DRD3_9GAMM|nr:hypothetical protein [Thiorhodococcus mannitoliphagus]NEX19236.1 hypothetical protein [Thiorhodococcus mannitoliphagus]
MFAKSTLASAVAAAIGASAVGIQTAQADSVFFPYLALSETVASVVSVVNTGQAANELHYRLYYKSKAAAEDKAAPCVEFDVRRPTSPNDIQTFDVSGKFGSETQGVLFNDPGINNDWGTATFAFAATQLPARAYLLVDDNDSSTGEDTLSGEVFVFEYGSGAAWGYQAYSNDATNYNYSGYASEYGAQVNLLPFDEFETAFFVTPVGVDMAPNGTSSLEATIWLGSAGTTEVYDRDENPISGALPVNVVCVGRVDVEDLLSPITYDTLEPTGGWAQVYNEGSAAAGGTGAVVIKLEYNMGDTFNGEPVGGTYNNAEMIAPM